MTRQLSSSVCEVLYRLHATCPNISSEYKITEGQIRTKMHVHR